MRRSSHQSAVSFHPGKAGSRSRRTASRAPRAGHDLGDAEARGDRRAIAGVPREEPQDAARFAEGAHPLVEAGEVDRVDERVRALGEPRGVLRSRHTRDCAAIAARLGVPELVTPRAVPGSPFAAVAIPTFPGWNETALWCGGAAHAGGSRRPSAPCPASARRGGRWALDPALALRPPAEGAGRLPGGAPADGRGARARRGTLQGRLAEAVRRSRRDLPRVVRRRPSARDGDLAGDALRGWAEHARHPRPRQPRARRRTREAERVDAPLRARRGAARRLRDGARRCSPAALADLDCSLRSGSAPASSSVAANPSRRRCRRACGRAAPSRSPSQRNLSRVRPEIASDRLRRRVARDPERSTGVTVVPARRGWRPAGVRDCYPRLHALPTDAWAAATAARGPRSRPEPALGLPGRRRFGRGLQPADCAARGRDRGQERCLERMARRMADSAVRRACATTWALMPLSHVGPVLHLGSCRRSRSRAPRQRDWCGTSRCTTSTRSSSRRGRRPPTSTCPAEARVDGATTPTGSRLAGRAAPASRRRRRDAPAAARAGCTTASGWSPRAFLIKDLHIDWRRGERHFMGLLRRRRRR